MDESSVVSGPLSVVSYRCQWSGLVVSYHATGLSRWYLTLAATNRASLTSWMPRACPVDTSRSALYSKQFLFSRQRELPTGQARILKHLTTDYVGPRLEATSRARTCRRPCR